MEMYIAYDFEGIRGLIPDWGLGYWLMPGLTYVNLDCNVCVWMVPGTVNPLD